MVASYPNSNCNNQALLDDQIQPLMDFYDASDNTEYWNHTWNYNDLCEGTNYPPYGVTIDSNTRKITNLTLASNNISGTLTESLSNLNSLLWFDVSGNHLKGITHAYISFLFFNCVFVLILQHLSTVV